MAVVDSLDFCLQTTPYYTLIVLLRYLHHTNLFEKIPPINCYAL